MYERLKTLVYFRARYRSSYRLPTRNFLLLLNVLMLRYQLKTS